MTDSNEDGFTLELTRRRALGALLTIGAGSAAAGAGTFALFSDTEESSNNTIQAGTLDLTTGESSSLSFDMTNLAPGTSVVSSESVTLVSDGSLDGSLDIDVAVTGNDGTATEGTTNNVSANKMAKAIEVTELTYGGTNLLTSQNVGSVTMGTDDGFDSEVSYTSLYNITTNDWADTDDGETTENDFIDLGDPGESGTDFTLSLKFRSEAGNAYQNDGIDVTFTFVLNQQNSQ